MQLSTLNLALTRIGAVGGFSPASLFANGEQGVWYDPSEFTTMFTDAAGTTPVTEVEQPVGRILDKSGRGNHATQLTSTKRPVLSARYNLLTRTEEFDNAAWSKENLLAFGSGSTVNATTAPDGTTTADLITENFTDGTHNVYRNVSATASISYTFSVYFKRTAAVRNGYIQINNNGSGTGGAIVAIFDIGAVTSSTSVLVAGFTNVSSSISPAGSGWFRCSITLTSVATTTSLSMFNGIYNGARSYLGDGASGIFIWGAQLIVTNSLLPNNPYQRVVTGVPGTSIAAGTADYDTVGFPPYLKFDGTDDILNLPLVPFGATENHLIVVGVSTNVLASTDAFVVTNTTTNGLLKMGYAGGGGFLYALRDDAGGLTLADGAGTATVGGRNVMSGRTVGNDHILRVNTADGANRNVAIATTTLTLAGVGARPTSTDNTTLSNAFNGNVYSVIAVRGTVSNENRLNTETYVNSKTKAY